MTDHRQTVAWRAHWREETDASFLYRVLADAEHDAEGRRLYLKLADSEDRHAERWSALLAESDRGAVSHPRGPVRIPPARPANRGWRAALGLATRLQAGGA